MNPVTKISAFVFLLLVGHASIAQESGKAHRAAHPFGGTAAKPTVADAGEDNYDVKYVKFDLTANNTSTDIAGNVTTRAVVTAATMATYVFELNPLLTIDSVLFNGVNRSVAGSGVVRTVVLPTALSAGAAFTAQVFYHGTPTSGTLSSAAGINNLTSPSWGNLVTFTFSESYHSNEWWPCKQSLRDKIDSVDMWVTVPDTLKVGGNGILQHVTSMGSGLARYEWKERHPIDYYLIAFTVADFQDYSYYMHFTGSTDSMLIQNYIYNNASTLARFRSVIDSTGMMVNFFSSIYGRYPFWNEKYGHVMAPFSGGEEHQTMTTVGYFDGSLVAHELSHQWFGDNVTCGTWADIAMNEGFASYSEDLFFDHFNGHTRMLNDIKEKQTDVKSLADGAVYVDDTTSEARIFDYRLTYEKGACVEHMLRFVINDDSTFFRILRTYQQLKGDSTATIAEFKDIAKSITGPVVNQMNIDTFFNQWYYGEGFPFYDIRWYQAGSDVYLKLTQTTSMPSSVPLFITPIELTLKSLAGDTTLRIFNNQSSQLYHFSWPKAMTGLSFDPNFWLLYKISGFGIDSSLDVRNASAAVTKVFPNPTATNWQLEGLQYGSEVVLADLSGSIIWKANTNGSTITVPASNCPPGIYLLTIVNGPSNEHFRLIKE